MNIPREVLDEAVRVSGAPTRTAAVLMGLEELIRRKRLEALLKLKGSGAVRISERNLKKMRAR